uniref:Uncharacterized protein n=1 Tax=Podarcis muralis TaxID=64176 RepID=A0A670HVI8_PODMU
FKKKMKGLTEDHLYLDYINQNADCVFPLHTSISLFLLSYCDSCLRIRFRVFSEEPVRVHNDDKFEDRKFISKRHSSGTENLESSPAELELRLYFTLADVVLFPCIHHFFVRIYTFMYNLLRLPLISSWFQRVQEVPGIKRAAAKCNMQFLPHQGSVSLSDEHMQFICTASDEPQEEHEDTSFIGGPRPTMTKLMKSGIEATFSPHPCPSWALDWDSLPAAVNPGEGKFVLFALCYSC